MDPDGEKAFKEFYEEVKIIETRDSIMNSKDQVNRLNRPGSTYFNLNPYDVLMVDPDTPMKEIQKKYKQLMFLLHPDKNREDTDRAKTAFEAAQNAWKTLNNADGIKKCEEVVDEAKLIVNKIMDEKRCALRKAGAKKLDIDEDDPIKFKHSVYVQTCKLFADLERLRVEEERKKTTEKKRKLDKEAEEKAIKDQEKETAKNYEESREMRVSSWQNFAKKAKMSKYKPAKTKMETRLNKK